MLRRMVSKQGSEVSSSKKKKNLFLLSYIVLMSGCNCNSRKSPLGNNRKT